jgi:hypothetical protein
VRDLANARLLPVRQSIGQFLSRYPVASLATGLKSVKLGHGSAVGAEARVLLGWIKDRLAACGASGEALDIAQSEAAPRAFSLGFAYDGAKTFSWKADIDSGHATFDADFGSGRTVMPATAALLAQENALSEAMFF